MKLRAPANFTLPVSQRTTVSFDGGAEWVVWSNIYKSKGVLSLLTIKLNHKQVVRAREKFKQQSGATNRNSSWERGLKHQRHLNNALGNWNSV